MKKWICAMLTTCTMGCTCPMTEECSTSPKDLEFLRAEGRDMVNESGEVVALRGSNSGSWLLIEPWMLDWANQAHVESEKDLWDLMEKRFGTDAKQELIKTHRANYFTESDVKRLADLNLNCLRVPIWWRAVSDPDYGGDIAYTDNVIQWCKKHGLYAILDLHGAPGGQSVEDKIVGEPSEAEMWSDPKYRQQAIDWWKMMAERYKDEPVVAGYDVLNEAYSATVDQLVSFYDELYAEIRKIDQKHVIWFEDGLLGFHRLPRPVDMGWENVAYSFHYYPQDPEEAYRADYEILPKFNRMAVHYDVPILVGEFNTMHYERGGTETFRRYVEVFENYGWSWTFWNYKKLENDHNIIWGLVGYWDGVQPVDLNTASFEEIKAAFESMRTDKTRTNPMLATVLSTPVEWKQPPANAGAIIVPLSECHVLPAAEGQMRMEWQWNPPNVGFWGQGDRLVFPVEVPADGIYYIGVRMANDSSANKIALRVDSVHVGDFGVAHSGGWRNYIDNGLTVLQLNKGRHVIEIARGDQENAFINLQHLWIEPTRGDATQPDGDEIDLTVWNYTSTGPRTPIRGEWFNMPPNFGYWISGEEVHWDVNVPTDATYEVIGEYATINADTTLSLSSGTRSATADIPTTDDWAVFKTASLGQIPLKAGPQTLTVTWTTQNPEGAGNLRAVRLQRID